MNISAPFIQRPVMTTLLMVAILLGGFFAFRKLPVSDLPDIEHPMISVEAFYPGAMPETMVNLVAIPLEKELMNIPGLKEISSTNQRGHTEMSLEFDFGKDLDKAAHEVQIALRRVDPVLPKDMEDRPSYRKQEAGAEHMMYFLLTSNSASITEMRDYADLYIIPRFSRIDGVSKVEAFGPPFAVKIKLNPELMLARHVSLNQVVEAVRGYNSELPLGSIKTGIRTLTLEIKGKPEKGKDFAHILIAPGPVYLKDIATITDGAGDEREFHFVTKEKNALTLILGVKKASGGNTVAISNAIQAELPEIKNELPPSMNLISWFDKADYIKESIVDVEWSLLIAFALVVVVIFFSLGRLTDAFIPSIALPMSLVGTFIAMWWLNFNIDILSLLALTLAVGFVVDDAIVVLENIVRHHEKGVAPLEASLIGSKEICFTIVSMTLSLMAVFVPILFMGGMNGRLFHEFSITLAIAILVSGFISLTLTPMLCSRLLISHSQVSPLQKRVTAVNQWMVHWYERSLRFCLTHPKTILGAAIASLLAIIPLFNSLPIKLFPEEDRGFVFSIVTLPHGISEEREKEYQKKIEEGLIANPYVKQLISIVWRGNQIFLSDLIERSLRPAQPEVIQQLQGLIDQIPGPQSFTFGWQMLKVDLDWSSGGNSQFLLRGVNQQELEMAAENLKKKMQESGQFPFINLDLKTDEPKLEMTIDEDKANVLHISKTDIQNALQLAFSGGTISHIQKGGDQFHVYMELEKPFQNLSGLSKINLSTSDSKFVPLKALVDWKETLGSPALYRVDQLPAITLGFSANPGVTFNETLALLEKLVASTLPPTVKGKLVGAASHESKAVSDTTILVLAAILAMYLVLGMLYESFIHPLTILSSLPFAGLGGVLTLLLFGETLSLFSMVGFLLLIGIVKKNGIMIVDYALEARKTGSSPLEAITHGCLIRFRPIMMTTISAIMGALPIAIGFGEGAETRKGLGLVIVGGLLFSQMLTLYITPVIYLYLDKLTQIRWHPKVILSLFVAQQGTRDTGIK